MNAPQPPALACLAILVAAALISTLCLRLSVQLAAPPAQPVAAAPAAGTARSNAAQAQAAFDRRVAQQRQLVAAAP